MPLFVVATPIGNPKDITLRAVEAIRTADLVIGEEFKVLRQILKSIDVQAPQIERLNEHSTKEDIQFFVEECRSKNVALVSDCGTPGFCDPGADLVRACQIAGIKVHALPGPSSLMTLLSVSGERVDEFLFKGFLPAKNEDRSQVLKGLARENRAIVLMDTPYRLRKLLDDVAATFADRTVILGLNLTGEEESVTRSVGRDLPQKIKAQEAEPILIVLAKT